jgi:pyrroline-5-carboxylate reductase
VAPAQAVAVMLPYPGIAQGGSPILALGDVGVIEALFSPANTVYALRDAAELEAYLCAQAVLSPAVQMVGVAAEWLGGENAQGEAFLRHLVGSSLMSGECQSMLDALNTEGGYNQRLRQHLEAAKMREALVGGLDRLAGKA